MFFHRKGREERKVSFHFFLSAETRLPCLIRIRRNSFELPIPGGKSKIIFFAISLPC
jgi:hypothetical protein